VRRVISTLSVNSNASQDYKPENAYLWNVINQQSVNNVNKGAGSLYFTRTVIDGMGQGVKRPFHPLGL
jgi:hypothetical protein